MSRTQSKYSPLSNILTVVLKWQCHEMYWHFLFHESTPSGPLINRLKWFCSKISFRRFICKISDSAQANTARSLAGINVVFAVLACAESDYAQANNFFCFWTSQSGETLGSFCWFFEIFSKMFRKSCLTCAESDSAQANTARIFAGINFFFSGLSLPWKITFFNASEVLRYRPTFFH